MSRRTVTAALVAVIVAAAVAVVNGGCTDGSDVFVVDLGSSGTEWRHSLWAECVGSCHATMALRADWREHLLRAKGELGFTHVRFHGMFDDDMSVVLGGDPNNPTYSFFNLDQAFDWLVNVAGVKPLVELSFMPDLIATTTNRTIFHYKGNVSPPKRVSDWAALVKAFTSHAVGRFGIAEVATWWFEVWNEPNIDFWSGTQSQYFELLEASWHAIKSVDTRLRVGGPATAQSAWLEETIAFAKSRGIALDFISTHEYPSDPGSPPVRDNMRIVFERARGQVGKQLPIFYTEFNSGLDKPHHDDPYAAAFVIKTVMDADGVVDYVSYWTFTDIFEEGGQLSFEFQQGFGLQTIHGVPKPSWRAFELLHSTGTTRIPVTAAASTQKRTVDVLATRNATHVALFALNYEYVGNPINDSNVCVKVVGVPSAWSPQPATMKIIDETFANPAAKWREMGSPTYPTTKQIAAMVEASKMGTRNAQYTRDGDTITFEDKLTPYSVHAIFIPIKL